MTEEERENLLKLVDNISSSISSQQTAINSLIEFLTNLQKENGGENLTNIINLLNNISANLNTINSRLPNLKSIIQSASVEEIEKLVSDELTSITAAAKMLMILSVK